MDNLSGSLMLLPSDKLMQNFLYSDNFPSVVWRKGIAKVDDLSSHHYKYIVGIMVDGEDVDFASLNSLLMNVTQGITSDNRFLIVLQLNEYVYTSDDDQLKTIYSALLKDGFLEIVFPKSIWFKGHPKISTLASKEMVDLVHLMSYASARGSYSLFLHRELNASSGVLTEIDGFINEVNSEDWLSIDFAVRQDLYGKLFKSSHMFSFVDFLLQHISQSGDMSTAYQKYANIMHPPCDLSKKGIETSCQQELGLSTIQYRPSLFWNSVQSSARRDPNIPVGHEPYPWEKVPIYLNPSAQLWTSMHEIEDHTLHNAYSLNGYLMVQRPVAGDVVFVNFTPPVPLDEFFLRCWHSGHPEAHFDSSTYVDVLPVHHHQVTLNNEYKLFKYQPQDGNYIKVGKFNERGIAEGPLGHVFGKIASFRIRVTANHSHNALIREMQFKMAVVPSSIKPCCEAYWKDEFASESPGITLTEQ